MATELNTSKILQVESLADPLDVIEKLRDLGLSQDISLPQLVVCSDHSACESSVLEYVSDIKFPVYDRDFGCIPTEIILRRGPSLTTTVNIRPGRTAGAELRSRAARFAHTREKPADLSDLINSAKQAMDLGKDSAFSDDVLQILVSGPEQPNLTLVDLPGLFYTYELLGQPQATKVQTLVEEYLKAPRTVILATFPAGTRDRHKYVLNMVKQTDPKGLRTFGVVTKADEIDRNTPMEQEILLYARNENTKFHFGLGCHVVRGARDKTTTSELNQQMTEDAFFANPPWDQLLPHQLGIEKLPNRLVECIGEIARSELPNIIREIDTLIQKNTEAIVKLGHVRTSGDQRKYLLTVVHRFHDCVKAALDGRYTDPYFSSQATKLRAELRHLDDKFAFDMKNRAHTFHFYNGAIAPSKLEHSCQPETITRRAMLLKVGQLMSNSRGGELSTTYDPSLVTILFQEQSNSWGTIAESYAQAVFRKTKGFLQSLLEDLCDRDTCDALLRRIVEPNMDVRWQCLKEKIEELLRPYRKRYLRTLSSELEKRVEWWKTYNSNPSVTEGLEQPHSAKIYLLSQMEAFYEIALKTFVDNVVTLGVQSCVLDELEEIILLQSIGELDEDQLAIFAPDPEETRAERVRIEAKLRDLRTAQEECEAYEKRNNANPVFNFQSPLRLSPQPSPLPVLMKRRSKSSTPSTKPPYFGFNTEPLVPSSSHNLDSNASSAAGLRSTSSAPPRSQSPSQRVPFDPPDQANPQSDGRRSRTHWSTLTWDIPQVSFGPRSPTLNTQDDSTVPPTNPVSPPFESPNLDHEAKDTGTKASQKFGSHELDLQSACSFALEHVHVGLSTSFPFDVRGWALDKTRNRYTYQLGPPSPSRFDQGTEDRYPDSTKPWRLSAEEVRLADYGIMKMVEASRDADGRPAISTDTPFRQMRRRNARLRKH